MLHHLQPPAVVGEYVEAVNAREWAAVAPCFTDDAEFWMFGAPVARGPENITARLREAITTFPETRAEIRRVTVGGPLVFVEMLLSGRTGAGEAFETNEADVIELTPDGTAIARISAWSASARRT